MSVISNFFNDVHVNALWVIAIYVIAINLVAFITFGRDKKKARRSEWRTPESTLFTLAIIGGSIGAILGMLFFRHKTRKWSFRIGLPAILILQIIIIEVLTNTASQISFM